MRGFWLLVHFMGFTLWLGGGVATMVAGVTAKVFEPAERLAAYRVSSRIHSILVAPGAILVVISGLVLAQPFMRGEGMTGGLLTMMTAGALGAVVAIFFSVPTAQRLGRLELDPRGELPESFFELRKRQIVVASIAGGLGILAMLGGTVFRG
jgi:hypothetical protein